MNIILKRIILILAISLGVADAVEKAEIRFLAESLPEEFGEVRWVANDKKGDPFQLSTSQLSDAFKVPERAFVLFEIKTNRELAKVILPAVGNSFLVILFSKEDRTMKAEVVGDSPMFRAGDLFLYNNTVHTIVGNAGETEILLLPGEGKPVRPSGARQDGNFDVSFSMRENSSNRVLRTMRWPAQTRFRSYGFFFWNNAKKRIEFRAVDEFLGADGGKGPKTEKNRK